MNDGRFPNNIWSTILLPLVLATSSSAYAVLVDIQQLPNDAIIDNTGHEILEKTGTYAQPDSTIKRGSHKNNWDLDVGRDSGKDGQSADVPKETGAVTSTNVQRQAPSQSTRSVDAASNSKPVISSNHQEPAGNSQPKSIAESEEYEELAEPPVSGEISAFNTYTASSLGLLPQRLGDPEAEDDPEQGAEIRPEMTEVERLFAGGNNFWAAPAEKRRTIVNSGFVGNERVAPAKSSSKPYVIMDSTLLEQVNTPVEEVPVAETEATPSGATSPSASLDRLYSGLSDQSPESKTEGGQLGLPPTDAGGDQVALAEAETTDTENAAVVNPAPAPTPVPGRISGYLPSSTVSNPAPQAPTRGRVSGYLPSSSVPRTAVQTPRLTGYLPSSSVPASQPATPATTSPSPATATPAASAATAQVKSPAAEVPQTTVQVPQLTPAKSSDPVERAGAVQQISSGYRTATDAMPNTAPVASGVAIAYKSYSLPPTQAGVAADQARVVFDFSYETKGKSEPEALYADVATESNDRAMKGVRAVAELKQSSKNGDLEHQARIQWDLLNQGWRELGKLEKQQAVDARMQHLAGRESTHNEEKSRFDTRMKAARSEVAYRASGLREPIVNNVVLRYQKQLEQGLVTRRQLADASLQLKQVRQQQNMYAAELRYLGFDGLQRPERDMLNRIEVAQLKPHQELLEMAEQTAIPLQQATLEQQKAELSSDYWDDATFRVYVEKRKDQTYDNDTIMGVRAELPLDFSSRSDSSSSQRYRANTIGQSYRKQLDADLKLLWQQYRKAVQGIHSAQQQLFVNQKLRSDIQQINNSRVSSIPLLELDAKEKAEVEAVDLTEEILTLRLYAYEALWNIAWRIYTPVSDVVTR